MPCQWFFYIFMYFFLRMWIVMYEKFERLLKQRGVKAAEVCRSTGISPQIITNWKRKGSGSLNAQNMKKIADFFEIDINYFYMSDEELKGLYGIPKKSEEQKNQEVILQLFYNDAEFRNFLKSSKWAEMLGL